MHDATPKLKQQRKRLRSRLRRGRPVLHAVLAGALVAALSACTIPHDLLMPEDEPAAIGAAESEVEGGPIVTGAEQLTFRAVVSAAEADPAAPTVEEFGVPLPLGPVELDGRSVQRIRAVPGTSSTGAPVGQWAIVIEFDATGAAAFEAFSTRLAAATAARPGEGRFALLLGDALLSAPEIQQAIPGGRIELLMGLMDRTAAESLVAQLRGAR